MACMDFGRAQIHKQVNASFSPFGHPTQVDTSHLYRGGIHDFCDLCELASRLAKFIRSGLKV